MQKLYTEIIEHYIASYNAFDIHGMTRDIHEDIVFENISDGKIDVQIEGIENLRKQAEAAKEYFKERRQTITSWDFHDDVVIIDIQYTGVLAMDLPNGMKAGETIVLKGKSEFYFQDGKIKKLQDKS